MIPLDSATAVLPRMPTGRAIPGDFPLTIIKPPVVDVKCRTSPSAISTPIYRLLRSRNQRRNSSASSVRINCSTRAECKQFLPERVDVFELKDGTRQNMQLESVLCDHGRSTCTLPDSVDNCHEKSAPSRRTSLISSAKERRVSLQDEQLGSGEINKDAKQLQPLRISAMEIKENIGNPESEIKENDDCQLTESKLNNDHPVVDVKTDDSSSVVGTKQDDNAVVMETKLNEDCPCEQTNNRSRKKSSKSKKSPKKRRNTVKKATVTTGIFGRLANKQKKQQGQQLNSKEQATPRTNTHHSKDNLNKYFSIQKLHATYAPKNNTSTSNENNKNNGILLPRVSNTSLSKDNYSRRSTPSPRKQQELENTTLFSPLSSPRKLLNCYDDKVKKIYLSEAHSGMITGVPCAPPCTPLADELKKVEYIPSLSDVKSQRIVKTRLTTIGNKIRAEEQRRKEKAAKEEQRKAYGAILQLKQRQRAEIYALNKVMTELENENFKKFMEERSAEMLPV